MSVEPSKQTSLSAVLGHALGALAALLAQDAWRDAARLGLSTTQAAALAQVTAHGPARPGALAKQLGISAPTLSDALAALEMKGLVRRGPDPADSRAVLAAATEAGAQLAAQLGGPPGRLTAALDSLPEGEQDAMLRSLLRALSALEAGGQLPTLRACPGCMHLRSGAHPGAERPHHCSRFDSALGAANLRLDCPEFAPASPEQAQRGLVAWLEP